MRKQFLTILFTFCMPIAYADASPFWAHHARGWHWYDEPTPVAENKQPQTLADPVQQMAQIQEATNRARDAAIISPTEQNILTYVQLQNSLTAQASRFSTAWQHVLLTHPEINYSLLHPTDQIGRQIDLDHQRAQKEATLSQFGKTHGLFFFFRGTCPYCAKLAPTLLALSEHYHIPILPVSLDGERLPEFPNILPDNGVATKLKVSAVPALFVVEPSTQHIAPLAVGLVSQDELINRIAALSNPTQGP